MIEIKQLWKEYGANIVLERLNLNVKEGDFVSIVGASGCGKTTFLNMLLGTEQPSRGEILLDGMPISREPSVERGIVFQKYSVFPHLTVLENVTLGLEFDAGSVTSMMLGRSFAVHKTHITDEAAQMLKRVGLEDAMHKYPHELSGGMRQRLSIAQALIKKPRILLLDEPFGALDPGIRKDMHALITSLWQQQKLTIFMITHDLSEGFALGNRLWVFDHVRKDDQAQGRYGAQVTFDIDTQQDTTSERKAVMA
ncbi:ABC transporter ATP-binding protein [Marinomonas agarivorans]|nr:ABC transporter ATP-binding protein [Marinomonas agarivorans]